MNYYLDRIISVMCLVFGQRPEKEKNNMKNYSFFQDNVIILGNRVY